MSMIYSLVSRGKGAVLSSFSSCSGNFPVVSLDVLNKTDLSRTFGEYGIANYKFYTFVKDGFVFLAMVEANYETRIAINFLKQVQESFFARYDANRRSTAVANSLKDFDNILKDKMIQFNDKTKVDSLSNLKQHLTELEQQALQNMNKVIERGEKIEIMVKKSETLAEQSYDMNTTSKKVRDKMWWKNKKILIGIILLLAVVITIVVIIVVKA